MIQSYFSPVSSSFALKYHAVCIQYSSVLIAFDVLKSIKYFLSHIVPVASPVQIYQWSLEYTKNSDSINFIPLCSTRSKKAHTALATFGSSGRDNDSALIYISARSCACFQILAACSLNVLCCIHALIISSGVISSFGSCNR